MVNFLKKLLLAGTLLLISVSTAWAVEKTVVYLSIQNGKQDTGSSDSYLSTLESGHGTLKEDRLVRPEVLSFDFYQASGALANGFGVEIHRYGKPYTFADDSRVDLYAVGVLYGLNFYYRGDFWFPFIGFGTGNYSAKVQEKLNSGSTIASATVFGQVDTPFYYKIGARIPFNGWGIIFTQQYISADLQVATENKPLSLGGTATLFGLYYGF